MAVAIIDSQSELPVPDRGKRLVVRFNGAQIQEILVDDIKGRLLVGRAHFANICLPSCVVSRRHALIVKTDGLLEVMDLGSTNGTYVGGFRISNYTLEPGTVLTLGDCEIEFDTG